MTKQRNKEEELEHKINQYDELLNSIKQEKLSLVKQTDKIIKDAKNEARLVLQKAKEEANTLITEIKNLSEEKKVNKESISKKVDSKKTAYIRKRLHYSSKSY